MYCRKCGREIPNNTLFCNYCGAETETADWCDTPQPETNNEYRRKDVRARRCTARVSTIVVMLLIIYALHTYSSSKTERKVSSKPYVSSYSSEISGTSGNNDENYIDLIKGSYLTDYSRTVPIGRAFQNYFGNPQWYSGVSQNIRYVLFSGMATRKPDNSAVKIEFMFIVTDDKFEIVGWRSDGKDQPINTLPSILNSVFGE